MKPLYEQFTSKEQWRTVDVRRVSYVVIMILSFIVTEIGRHSYRPIIYRNEINDFGLADSIGNMGGIVVQVFFALVLFNSHLKQGFKLIVFLVVGYIFYEILQPVLPKGTFDWKDVYGTILGGAFAAILFFVIQKYFRRNRVLFKL
ncbi:hypothetical protein G0Q06_05680 [Puniceicoccales bacterium CK1056]|uniref:VanZ-like domain-containing protein n=1 Tax=Oceanipulchritudo coccoides TaxID=2706888 RepID=A0A6B2M1C7_9BACT|nr:VanZ family protein [Oceanipulchritudo coccoides]NDV61934.1 hypothetical protein [Oceanipulchritudo coccoides]